MEDMLTTEYDGCGRCLVGVRRLSRKTDKTSSPQRQGDQDLQAAVKEDMGNALCIAQFGGSAPTAKRTTRSA